MKLSRAVVSQAVTLLQRIIVCALIYTLVGVETAALAAGPPPPHGGGGMMAPPAFTPEAIFQEAMLFYLKRSMSAALPLKLDPSEALPTVPNSQLPGGPFQGRPLALTAENVSAPLPPGDYEIPVMAYCTQYSVHRPGQGAATTIAPVTGTQAEVISNLLWRGTQAKIPPGRLQTTAWAIQAGVPYERMSKQSQQDIDAFAPEGRADVEHGFSIDAPVRQLYNNMVANPRKYILEYKHEKGMNFPDFLIPNIKITAPSFDQLIAQAGPVGREYVRAEMEQQAVQQTLNDQEHGQESLLLHQAPTDPPLPPSQGPWTVRVPNSAYMRFVVNGGNMQANNIMQIRVLPTQGSYDDARLQTPHLMNASYQPMPIPAPITVTGLMGAGALTASQLAKRKGVGNGSYSPPAFRPIIAFPSIPAQALILVLPWVVGLGLSMSVGNGDGKKSVPPTLPAVSSTATGSPSPYDDDPDENRADRVEASSERVKQILADAVKGQGDFGLGTATEAEAEQAGEAWVGDGYKTFDYGSDGKRLVSEDGLRQYRSPQAKGKLGTTQANFESRPVAGKGAWTSNGHLDIVK